MMCTRSRTMDDAGMDEENGMYHLQLHQTTYRHLKHRLAAYGNLAQHLIHLLLPQGWIEHQRYVVRLVNSCRIIPSLNPFPSCIVTFQFGCTNFIGSYSPLRS